MRNEINLTTEQIEALFDEAFSVGISAGGPDGFGGQYESDVVFTKESLENFAEASNNYAECGRPVFSEAGGFRTLLLAGAQVKRGDQRRDVCVIDFGTVRACYK